MKPAELLPPIFHKQDGNLNTVDIVFISDDDCKYCKTAYANIIKILDEEKSDAVIFKMNWDTPEAIGICIASEIDMLDVENNGFPICMIGGSKLTGPDETSEEKLREEIQFNKIETKLINDELSTLKKSNCYTD